MPDKTNTRVRGRPRAFDEQAVITHAARVFLERGFEGVSYELLAKEVGLSKPSLYNTFGDKTALFERVLDGYAEQAIAFCSAQFESEATLQESVRTFLRSAADLYSGPGELSTGCLLIGTALPACSHPGHVRQTLTTFIRSLEQSLEKIISTQHKEEARSLGQSPQALALLLSSLLFALAIRARGGMSQQDLRAVAGELADLFPQI